MHKIEMVVVLALLSIGLSAQENAKCTQLVFEGQVRGQESFRRPIGAGLKFELNPSGGSATDAVTGWAFGLGPETSQPNLLDEYIYPFTPPYRSNNAQHIDTAYGVAAQDAVAGNHDFQFLLHQSDARRAGELLDGVLWPKNENEQQKSLNALFALPHSSGRLEVLDSKIIPGEHVPGFGNCDKQCGNIEWIKFRVTLILPRGFPAAAGTKSSSISCPP